MARIQVPDILKRYIEDFLGKRIRRGQISNKFEVGYAMERLEKAINRYLGDPKNSIAYLQNLSKKDMEVLQFLITEKGPKLFNEFIADFLENIYTSKKKKSKIAISKQKEISAAFITESIYLLEKMEVHFNAARKFVKISPETAEEVLGKKKKNIIVSKEVLSFLGPGKLKNFLGANRTGSNISTQLQKYTTDKNAVTLSSEKILKDKEYAESILKKVSELPEELVKILNASRKSDFYVLASYYLPHLFDKKRTAAEKSVLDRLNTWREYIGQVNKLGHSSTETYSNIIIGTSDRPQHERNAESISKEFRDMLWSKNKKGLMEYVRGKINAADFERGTGLAGTLKRTDPFVYGILMSFVRGSEGSINYDNVQKFLKQERNKAWLSSFEKSPNKVFIAFTNKSEMSRAVQYGFDPARYLEKNAGFRQRLTEKLLDDLGDEKNNFIRMLKNDPELKNKVLGSFDPKNPLDRDDAKDAIMAHIKTLEGSNSKVYETLLSLSSNYGIDPKYFGGSTKFQGFLEDIVKKHLSEAGFLYFASVTTAMEPVLDKAQEKKEVEAKKKHMGFILSSGRETRLVNLPAIWGIVKRYKLDFSTGSTWEDFENAYTAEMNHIINKEPWKLRRSYGIRKAMEDFAGMSSNPAMAPYRKFFKYASSVVDDWKKDFEDLRDLTSFNTADDKNKTKTYAPKSQPDPDARKKAERRYIFKLTAQMASNAYDKSERFYTIRGVFYRLNQANRDVRYGTVQSSELLNYKNQATREMTEIYKSLGKNIHTAEFKNDVQKMYIGYRDSYIQGLYARLNSDPEWKKFRVQAEESMYSQRYNDLTTLFTSMSDKTYDKSKALTSERRKLELASLEGQGDEFGFRYKDSLEEESKKAQTYTSLPQFANEMGVSSVYDMLVRRASTPEHVDEVMNFVYEIIPKSVFSRMEELNNASFDYKNEKYTSLEQIAAVRKKELEGLMNNPDIGAR